jgi:xylulokinase
MLFLGYDLGSSSIKACLFDGETGRTIGRASHPGEEMPIAAPRPGWAEQDPEAWWSSARAATRELLAKLSGERRLGDIGGIGISYQMHGLVLVDESANVLRPAIIWCDSRAVEIGNRAFRDLGTSRCLDHLLNSPGNFTASKLRWVRQEEPELFSRIHKILLPGDYFALRLTGAATTTVSGLSEGIFWDFRENAVADFLLDHYGLARNLLPEIVSTFGVQGRITPEAASELGLPPGIPVTFRAGDQPANALSLNVLEPGEIAATAGTSGVIYAVTDLVRADLESRVNSFAHVSHASGKPRLGVLLCINGAGSSNRWLRSVVRRKGYADLDESAAHVDVAADGLSFYPFGNGAERMLSNRDPGAWLSGLRFNSHGEAHLARAVQEGVAFAFRYGIGILGEIGLRPSVVRAPRANLFRSAVFREALVGTSEVRLELYDTDGAEGAARGAAMGASFYRSPAEAFRTLEREALVEPDPSSVARYREAYERWALGLEALLAGAPPPGR